MKASFRGPFGNRGNEAHEVCDDDAAPCKLNNAEAKRTHQVGAVRRRTATEMNLSDASEQHLKNGFRRKRLRYDFLRV